VNDEVTGTCSVSVHFTPAGSTVIFGAGESHRRMSGCVDWQPDASNLSVPRGPEPTVEYRVAREWAGPAYRPPHSSVLDGLETAKELLRLNAEDFGPELRSAWIETRKVNPWTRL